MSREYLNARVCFLLQRVLRNHAPVRTWASLRWRMWINVINGILARAAGPSINRKRCPSGVTARRCVTLRRETRIGEAASWTMRSRSGEPTTSTWSMRGWAGEHARIAVATGSTRSPAITVWSSRRRRAASPKTSGFSMTESASCEGRSWGNRMLRIRSNALWRTSRGQDGHALWSSMARERRGSGGMLRWSETRAWFETRARESEASRISGKRRTDRGGIRK